MLAFEVAGGEAAAFTVLNNLQLIDISNNLGDSKSLACHPYTTTHSNMSPEDRASLGISGGHIRLSVGLENADDLIEDLDQALAFLGTGNQVSLCASQQHKKHPFREIGGCFLLWDSVN